MRLVLTSDRRRTIFSKLRPNALARSRSESGIAFWKSLHHTVEPDGMKAALVLGVVTVVAGCPAVSARNQSARVATFPGTCTRVMPKNVVIDPAACSDTVTKLELPDGQTGFTFMLTKQGESKAALMSFFGTVSTHVKRHNGDTTLPIHRVYFTSNDNVDDLAAVGSCVFVHPPRKAPAKVSCSANTTEGNFAAEFISDGAAPSMNQIR